MAPANHIFHRGPCIFGEPLAEAQRSELDALHKPTRRPGMGIAMFPSQNPPKANLKGLCHFRISGVRIDSLALNAQVLQGIFWGVLKPLSFCKRLTKYTWITMNIAGWGQMLNFCPPGFAHGCPLWACGPDSASPGACHHQRCRACVMTTPTSASRGTTVGPKKSSTLSLLLQEKQKNTKAVGCLLSSRFLTARKPNKFPSKRSS